MTTQERLDNIEKNDLCITMKTIHGLCKKESCYDKKWAPWKHDGNSPWTPTTIDNMKRWNEEFQYCPKCALLIPVNNF